MGPTDVYLCVYWPGGTHVQRHLLDTRDRWYGADRTPHVGTVSQRKCVTFAKGIRLPRYPCQKKSACSTCATPVGGEFIPDKWHSHGGNKSHNNYEPTAVPQVEQAEFF